MRSRKKKPTEIAGLKRMNINLDSELHQQFKTAVSNKGENMTGVLIAFIQGYVAKHYPKGGR
jgi:hypothetical protein